VRTIDTTSAEPLSWRPNDRLKAAGHPFSRPMLFNEIRAGRIDARKIGKNTARARPGWDAWGNETQKFATAGAG
jgi:hypothetical protein